MSFHSGNGQDLQTLQFRAQFYSPATSEASEVYAKLQVTYRFPVTFEANECSPDLLHQIY
jgi:hypothetical protein